MMYMNTKKTEYLRKIKEEKIERKFKRWIKNIQEILHKIRQNKFSLSYRRMLC